MNKYAQLNMSRTFPQLPLQDEPGEVPPAPPEEVTRILSQFFDRTFFDRRQFKTRIIMRQVSEFNTEQFIFHSAEPIPPHHLRKLLIELNDDFVNLDEIVQLLQKTDSLPHEVIKEAERVVEQSSYQHEIKSLKHAIVLLGMAHLKSYLSQFLPEHDTTFRRTA